MAHVCGVSQGSQCEDCHEEYAQDRATDENPAHGLDLRLCIATKYTADFVVDLLNLEYLSVG